MTARPRCRTTAALVLVALGLTAPASGSAGAGAPPALHAQATVPAGAHPAVTPAPAAGSRAPASAPLAALRRFYRQANPGAGGPAAGYALWLAGMLCMGFVAVQQRRR